MKSHTVCLVVESSQPRSTVFFMLTFIKCVVTSSVGMPRSIADPERCKNKQTEITGCINECVVPRHVCICLTYPVNVIFIRIFRCIQLKLLIKRLSLIIRTFSVTPYAWASIRFLTRLHIITHKISMLHLRTTRTHSVSLIEEEKTFFSHLIGFFVTGFRGQPSESTISCDEKTKRHRPYSTDCYLVVWRERQCSWDQWREGGGDREFAAECFGSLPTN